MKLSEFICAFALSLYATTPAFAEGVGPSERLDAQAMIDACWDETHELRSGSTANAREGILLSALCLEERILDQFEVLFSPTVLTRDEAAAQLESIRRSYGGLYWKLYNAHQGCGACGTQYHTMHVDAHARLMERILRDAIDQRNQYKL